MGIMFMINYAKSILTKVHRIFSKFMNLGLFIMGAVLSYILLSLLWNTFVFDQQFLILDTFNITPSLYKPTFNLFSLFSDFWKNPIQQSFLLISLIDSKTFWKLWYGRVSLFFLLCINFIAFTIVILNLDLGVIEGIKYLFYNANSDFWGWTVKIVFLTILLLIKMKKQEKIQTDDHILKLLNDGQSSIIDLFLHTNMDISNALNNKISENSDFGTDTGVDEIPGQVLDIDVEPEAENIEKKIEVCDKDNEEVVKQEVKIIENKKDIETDACVKEESEEVIEYQEEVKEIEICEDDNEEQIEEASEIIITETANEPDSVSVKENKSRGNDLLPDYEDEE